VGNLRCPFHAWQYGLDGANQYVHDRSDFAELTPEYLCLRQCQVGTWAGWVFINIDSQAPPLEVYLAPLPERLAGLNLADMRYMWEKTLTLPCNWKTALDAFSESYHVPGTHPRLIRPLVSSNRPASRRELLGDPSFAPSEVIGANVTRFSVEPKDPTSPRYATKEALLAMQEYHVRELRALNTQRDLRAARDLSERTVPDGPGIFPAFRQRVWERALAEGLTWPQLDPAQLHHAEGAYTIFPNTILYVRQMALLGYRSFPNGLDPDSCIFDVFALELVAPGKAPEFIPETHTDWREADVGEILSQDFSNIEDVTAGLHSSAFSEARLSPIQEIGVFFRHVKLDEYLFGPAHEERGVERGATMV
jgi:hypothetical protein